MNVLFISNDPQIFKEGSAVRARMRTYAGKIGTLHILSRAVSNSDSEDGTLVLHGRAVSKVKGWRQLLVEAKTLIAEHSINVVSTQDPFEYGYIGMKAVEGTSAKLHVQIHTDFLSPWFTRGGIFRSPQLSVPTKNIVRKQLAKRVLKKADGIRVVSERIANSLRVAYGSSIVEPVVIPIAVSSVVPERVDLPEPHLPFTLITIGRLEPEKRMDDILVALSSLRDAYPIVGLVIVGEGNQRKHLEEKVAELKLEDKVTFLGSRNDAWGLMQSAQAYIQASAYEGYGMTLVEAALARIPIITSDVGIVGEVLVGYEDVLVSPPGDPTNLAYHIISLVEDVATRERIVRSAQAKALKHLAQNAQTEDRIVSNLRSVESGSKAV